jgi:hypothetical protein
MLNNIEVNSDVILVNIDHKTNSQNLQVVEDEQQKALKC